MNTEEKGAVSTITFARIKELISQFETSIATYNGRTPLKLSRNELRQVMLYHHANPNSVANNLLKLVMDFAAMSNNEKLFNQLSKIKNVQINEVTLIRAILCGRDRIVSQLLTFPSMTVPPMALVCAFFSTLQPLLILQISELLPKGAISVDEIRNAYQPDELRLQFDCEVSAHPTGSARALIYFIEKLSHQGNYCPPVSLFKLFNNEMNVLTDNEKNQITKCVSAIMLVIKNPGNTFYQLNLKKIYQESEGIDHQKLMFVSPELAAAAMHFSMMGNDISSIKTLAMVSKPTSESLNIALLSNVTDLTIFHLLSYPEVQPDENTLHCLLFSKANTAVVDALLARSVSVNENTLQIMRYSHLNPEAIVKIARHCHAPLPQLNQTVEDTVQFYKQHCPELAALMPVPAIFVTNEMQQVGLPETELERIKSEEKLSELIATIEEFTKKYNGSNDDYAIKHQVDFALEMIAKQIDEETKKLGLLLLDYAAMTGDEALFDKLHLQHQLKPDEETLKRAVLCGSNSIIRRLLAAGVAVSPGMTPIFALFSVIEKDLIINIFNRVDKSDHCYLLPATNSFHSSALLQEIFARDFKPEAPERALLYFKGEYSSTWVCDMQPVSLELIVARRLKDAVGQQAKDQMEIQNTQVMQSITVQLKELITKKQDMKSSLFFESEIHAICQRNGYFNIVSFSPEIRALFLEYAVVSNSNISFIGLTKNHKICPNVTTLNRAILCGANKVIIHRILGYENVVPDKNTLLCILISDLPKDCVEKIMKKGLVANPKAISVMIYSQQSSAVNELIASQLFNIKIEPTKKTTEEVRAFYQKECPELVLIFNEPAALSKVKSVAVSPVPDVENCATNSMSI